ncbi:MAG: hypothetical protein NTZ64_09610 [Polaromonas sp.]|nr:hypothetical protein [Polaromonas sp.]
MQSNSGKSGKCSNFGNCSLADARVTIEVPTGLDFVCNECGKPLLQTDGGGAPAGGSKALLIGLGLAALLLAGGGGAWFLGKKAPDVVAVPAPVSVPAPKPAPAPTDAAAPTAAETAAAAVAAAKAAATAREQVPLNPSCSEADERAGLCRTH